MDYPIKFDKCPNCGSEDRIVEIETRSQVIQGKMKVGSRVPCMVSQSAIFSPAEIDIIAPRSFPMLIGLYDVCAECGTFYCIEMIKQTATAQPNIRRDDHGVRPT